MAIVKAPLKTDAAGKCTRWRVCTLLLVLALGVSEAAQVDDGRWTDVTVTNLAVCVAKSCGPKGWLVVGLSATAGRSPPACSKDNRDTVAVDVSTAAGEFAAQLLRHSIETGSKLTIVGTGTCDLNSEVETLGFISERVNAERPN
jgi:hypothetical protein